MLNICVDNEVLCLREVFSGRDLCAPNSSLREHNAHTLLFCGYVKGSRGVFG